MRLLFYIFIVTFCFETQAVDNNLKTNTCKQNAKNNLISSFIRKNNFETYDPLEKLNRKILIFNGALDYVSLRPIAKAYNYAPARIRKGVHNICENIKTPLSTINYLLQIRPHKALLSLWKFIFNTTLGLGGIYNFSHQIDLDIKHQTFGSTLAYYGLGPGPYIILPILGPTNFRDMLDLIFLNTFLNPLKHSPYYANLSNPIAIANIISDRAIMEKNVSNLIKNSQDPYVAIKSMFMQNAENKLDHIRETMQLELQ